MPKIA